jgi:hypothetical protein
MRVANRWVVVGAAAAVAGFAGGAAAADTTRDIKLNDPIAVEQVAGQLSAVDPGQHVDASADDAGQQFWADDSPGAPGSPDSPGDSPDSTADSPDSTADDHAGSAESTMPASGATANPQQQGDDSHHDGADSAESPDGED